MTAPDSLWQAGAARRERQGADAVRTDQDPWAGVAHISKLAGRLRGQAVELAADVELRVNVFLHLCIEPAGGSKRHNAPRLRDLQVDDLPRYWVRWVNHGKRGPRFEDPHDPNHQRRGPMRVHRHPIFRLDALGNQMIRKPVAHVVNLLVRPDPIS